MSSYAGRYRSRLFNFLSQQTSRWGDKGDRALRHIKVGAIWGTQILLYPVYLIFQAARLVGKQIQQAIRQNIDPAAKNLPPSDSPVLRVLEMAVASPPSAELSEDDDRVEVTKPQQVIQGIASELETHNLVLVTTENQIADIFDRTQQHELEKLISLEISDYLHHQLVAKETHPKLTNRLPFLDDRPQLLPPLRFFRKAMAWVQTSPVATLVNLFQEEAVLLNLEVKTKYLKQRSQALKSRSDRLNFKSEELKSKNHLSAIGTGESAENQPPSLIVKLDSAIAELETGNLAVVVKVTDSLAHRSQEFLQIVKSRFADVSPVAYSQPKADNSALIARDDSPANIFTMQALIKGAIEYFFGKDGNNKLASPPQTAISVVSEVASEEENPWLTESVLFGEPVVIKIRPRKSIKKEEPEDRKVTLPAKNSAYTAYLPPTNNIDTNNSKSAQKNKKADRNYPATQPKNKTSRSPNVPVQNAISNTSVDSDRDNFYYYDSQEDSIEVKAKPAGYVKHPLEQILQWLDSAMLWLEELIVKIWHSFLGR